MIRIRKISKNPNNQVITLPSDAAFIEVCDDEGKIACVLSFDALNQTFNIFDGNSEKANRYKKFFNVNFIHKSINLPNNFLNISK